MNEYFIVLLDEFVGDVEIVFLTKNAVPFVVTRDSHNFGAVHKFYNEIIIEYYDNV